MLTQDHNNKESPLYILGTKGYRTVNVESVIPISSLMKGHHQSLAQVQFVMTDHLFNQSTTVSQAYKALVSWRYKGMPNDPQQMFNNWDGFEITHYLIEPMNVHHSKGGST